jgi:hypothetical protein
VTSPETRPPAPDDLARDLLVEARRRVQRGWCQRTAARDAAGRSVLPSDPAAASWSAAGAVMAAARRKGAPPAPFARAMAALSQAVGAGPQGWNDQPERTAAEVVAALERAARLLGRRRARS